MKTIIILLNYVYTLLYYTEIMKRNASSVFHFVAMFIALIFNILLAIGIIIMHFTTFYISIKEKKTFLETLKSFEK